jgi:hypothetical protein
VIALQLAGAGAGVAAALAVGRAGPARAAGGAVAGAAGPQGAGVRWLVLAGSVVLVLAVPLAAWWLIGDRYSSLNPGAEYLIRPFPVSRAAERAAGRGSVLAAVVAATWLTWASVRGGFDLRWWSVLGPLLAAGILAGFIWRVFTARVGGAPIGTGCVILSACPVLAALLGWAVTRSLTLLYSAPYGTVALSLDPAPTPEDSAPARKTGGEQSACVSRPRWPESPRNPSRHSTVSRVRRACRYGRRQEG